MTAPFKKNELEALIKSTRARIEIGNLSTVTTGASEGRRADLQKLNSALSDLQEKMTVASD